MNRLSLLCVLGGSAVLFAQQGIPADELQAHASPYLPPSQKPLRVETRLVEVGVVVRDSRGHPVAGLAKDDFEIEESGRRQEITAFSVEAGAASQPVATETTSPAAPALPAVKQPPRLLALIFDDLGMAPSDLISVRSAAKRFSSRSLQDGDEASIFATSRGQVLPFTSDVARIDEALNTLSVRTREAGMSTCPYLTSYEALLISERMDPTILPAKVQEARSCGLCTPRDPACPSKVENLARVVWDQARDTSRRTLLFLSEVEKYMANLPGRRVIVLASSGFLSRTLEQERDDVINRALRSQVVINSLDAKGLFTQDLGTTAPAMSLASTMLRQSLGTRPQMENNDSLAFLSESTGGLFFHNNNDLVLGFRELGLAPVASYTLAFSPTAPPDNRYHALKVRLKTKGRYSIQARPGYYARIVPPPPPAPERPIDKEILSSDTPDDVPVAVIASSTATARNEPAVHVILHFDIQHLRFTMRGKLRTLQLSFVAALFDENSSFVAGQEAHASLALKSGTFDRLVDGLNLGLTLKAPPGRYRLRCAIREEQGGRFTSILRPVEIQK